MTKKKMLILPLMLFAFLATQVTEVSAARGSLGYASYAEGIVNYARFAQHRTTEQMYVNVGEKVMVKTHYSIELNSVDKDVYFAVENSAANNTRIDLGELSKYVQGKKLNKEQMLTEGISEKIYNGLIKNITNPDNCYYYYLSENQVKEILDGGDTIRKQIYMYTTYDAITDSDFEARKDFSITTATEGSSQFAHGDYNFNKASYAIELTQEIENKEYEIGDTISVSLKLENTSNVYIENAVLNIYNSKTEKSPLSNISNVEIAYDEKSRIWNDYTTTPVSWNSLLKQKEEGSIYIGSWQGSQEFRNTTDNNNIYISFDYVISKEDLDEEGELVIRSVLSATSPENSYMLNAYKSKIEEETAYYYTGEPLSKIERLEDEETDIFQFEVEKEIEEEKEKEEEKEDEKEPGEEKEEEKIPEEDEKETPEDDEGEVLGETHEVSKDKQKDVVKTDDVTQIMKFIVMGSFFSFIIFVVLKKGNKEVK